MERLRRSGERLGFHVSTHAIGNLLQVLIGRVAEPSKVRLVVAEDGAHALSLSPLPEQQEAMTCAVVPLPVPPDDIRLFHKTSDRGFYDEARRSAATDEVVFEREDGLLTEGSFTNIFLKRGDEWLTPRADAGLLPGVLRAELLADGKAREAELTRADLETGELWLGNSVRGLTRAQLVAPAKPRA
jgi:para-aminobenzoate synthetase/4-amino-4-deoxychorismate lyase